MKRLIGLKSGAVRIQGHAKAARMIESMCLFFGRLYMERGELHARRWRSQDIVIKPQDIVRVHVCLLGGRGISMLGIKTIAGNFKASLFSKVFPEVMHFLLEKGERFSRWQIIALKLALRFHRWQLSKAHIEAIERAIKSKG